MEIQSHFGQVNWQKQTGPGHSSGPKSHARYSQPETTKVEISLQGKLRSIMESYDVKNISHSERIAMAKELYGAGAIDEQTYAHMSKPPPDFSEVTGQAKPDMEERLDMISVYENKIAFQKANGGDDKSIEFNERLLSVFKALVEYQA